MVGCSTDLHPASSHRPVVDPSLGPVLPSQLRVGPTSDRAARSPNQRPRWPVVAGGAEQTAVLPEVPAARRRFVWAAVLGQQGLLWCFLPGLLGWLWLLPRRAASAFWGTTIRGTGDQIEFRLDAQHLVESCCEEVSTAAHLYGISCAVIIEANGQQFAVKAYDLGIAVDGHPDQARFVL